MGTIIGFGGRAILPGGQDIGLGKTIGLGVLSAFLVSLIASGLGFFGQVIFGSIVAAGLLWLAIIASVGAGAGIWYLQSKRA